LLPKDLSFEHGGAKLASSPGAIQPRYTPVPDSSITRSYSKIYPKASLR